MIPIKKQYSLSLEDFSDSYIIGYDAGSMGDFFLSLLMISHYIKANVCMPDLGNTDNYFYSCESKKWVVNDSIDSGLRFFTSKDDRDNYIRRYKLENNPYANTELELGCSLLSITKLYPNKLKTIPYFFISENLTSYLNRCSSKQAINQGNFIYVYMSEKPDMIKNILRFYKNYFWQKFRTGNDTLISKQQFIENTMHEMNHDAEHNYRCMSMNNLKTSTKFDINKLLFNNDVQELKIIDTQHPFIANMISTTKNDISDILNFYGYSIDTAMKLTMDDIPAVYDQLVDCHAQHKY